MKNIIFVLIAVFCLVITSCGNHHGDESCATTEGIKCDPEPGTDGYRIYCFEATNGLQAFILSQATVSVDMGTSTQVLWKNVKFPSDGVFYCGWTAYDVSGESDLSARIGVNKAEDRYCRTN